MSALICLLFVTCLVYTPLVYAFEPSIRWVRRLSGCGTLSDASTRKGNGVVAAQSGKNVWVTVDDGSLHIVDANNGTSNEITFNPPIVEQRMTESRSSVTLWQNDTTVEYAVYAVVDVATDDPTESTISSRLIVVYGDGDLIGKLKWQVTIEGIAAGTPQIGTGGERVYITHNTNDQGYLSVFGKDGNVITRTSSIKAFGPVAVLSTGGINELRWGESEERGYSVSGRMYHFESSAWLTNVGNEISTSTVVRPALWGEGKRRRMWLGGTSSTVHGWVDGRNFSEMPTWSKQLDLSLRNESYPIINNIVASPDGLRLYVPSASTSFYCLNAKNGNIMWKSETYDSIFLTGAILSPDFASVYSIRHRDGTIEKRSTSDGELLWRFNCSSIPGRHPTCQDSVEAEFSLSSDGNSLYYSDIWGSLISLEVNDITAIPSGSPSMQPSTSSIPSTFPSTPPSEFPSAPSNEPSSSPTVQDSGIPSSGPSEGSEYPSSIPSSYPSAVEPETGTLAPPRKPTTDDTANSADQAESTNSPATVNKLATSTLHPILTSILFVWYAFI